MGITIRKLGDHTFELDVRSQRVVSVKLDQKLLEHMDDAWKKAGYNNRSHFIRDAIRTYIEILQAGGHPTGRRPGQQRG